MINRIAERLDVELTDEIREGVADDQVRMVWAHAAVASIVASIFAVVAALHLIGTVDTRFIQIWIAIKLVVAAPRVVLSQFFRHVGMPSGLKFRQITYVLLAVDGAVWGLPSILLPRLDTSTASLIAASLCGVACVATFGFQVSRLANAAYVLPIMSPVIIGMLIRFDAYGFYGAISLSLLLVQVLITANRTDSKLSEVFLLRIHTARISAEKAEALEQKEHALVLLQRQSAVKSLFLGTVSHELRTPIHGMLGIARLVHVKSDDPTVKRNMELVQSSGTHLLGLVTDLIDLSSLDAGQLRIRLAPFDISKEIGRVAEIYAVRAAEKGLRFELQNDIPDGTWVVSDAARTRQILHNLLGNAIKFTKKGTVQLVIEPHTPSRSIHFIVRDTGVGISASDQKLVFRAFEQIDSKANGRRQGTGLGLTIANEIAALLGGRITLTSEPGVGSTFDFVARFEPAAPPQTADDEDDESKALQRGARILLAEDNDVNFLIASSILANKGHQVERAHDGIEAVQQALREIDRPDLILMDCMMPNMSGFEATRSIRAQERAMGMTRIPIIALSAVVEEELTHGEISKCGMDGRLGKPFTDDELIKVMRPWLANREDELNGAEESLTLS